MALIKCPECGKQISNKAEMCINCGYPLKELLNDSLKLQGNEIEKIESDKGIDNQEVYKPAFTVNKIVNTVKKNSKPLSLNKYFSLLFECAVNEAKVLIDPSISIDYTFGLFAAWDIILSEKKNYNKYASRDWLEDYFFENKSELISELGEDWSNQIGRYEDARYRTIEVYTIDENVNPMTKYDDYIGDVFRFSELTIDLDSDEEHLQFYLAGLNITFEDVISSFSSVKISDDYIIPQKPTLEEYNLPQNIATKVKRAELSFIHGRRIRIAMYLLLPGALLVGLGIIGSSNKIKILQAIGWCFGLPIAAAGAWSLLTGLFSSKDGYEMALARDAVAEKNDDYKRYYEYENRLAWYQERYCI